MDRRLVARRRLVAEEAALRQELAALDQELAQAHREIQALAAHLETVMGPIRLRILDQPEPVASPA